MNEADRNSSKPVIHAFLGGIAVAFAMVGATLFWVSSQNDVKKTPLDNGQKPSQVVAQPVTDSIISETQNATSSGNVFSSTPKKVKSLSIETKVD